MEKITLVIHGGAGDDSELIRSNAEGYKAVLKDALDEGYAILEKGGASLDAVEKAINILEDHPLFNAGKGSSLNEKGEVEMSAGIMDGHSCRSGAVTLVKNIRNPITLARMVMEKTDHVFIGGEGALRLGRELQLRCEEMEYFLSDHQVQKYLQEIKKGNRSPKVRGHGTVGAVALDRNGNLAAGTSTGGLEFQKEGRVADSAVVGTGVYANNDICAVSATGDGEYIIKKVVAYDIAALMQYRGMDIRAACSHLIREKLNREEGEVGVIAVDRLGNFSLEFNCGRMHRAWRTSSGESGIDIYH